MRERPIIFDSESVQRILDGTKTRTRRVIKNTWQPSTDRAHLAARDHHAAKECPYGKPGDRLWVRETHAYIWPYPIDNGIVDDPEYPEGRPIRRDECEIEYKADTLAPYPGDWPPEEAKGNPEAPKWNSPLFMPRWASRITLYIEWVWVERLHDIETEEIIAEGISTGGSPPPSGSWEDLAFHRFRERWDALNAKRGYPYEINPWVWVIRFGRIE